MSLFASRVVFWLGLLGITANGMYNYLADGPWIIHACVLPVLLALGWRVERTDARHRRRWTPKTKLVDLAVPALEEPVREATPQTPGPVAPPLQGKLPGTYAWSTPPVGTGEPYRDRHGNYPQGDSEPETRAAPPNHLSGETSWGPPEHMAHLDGWPVHTDASGGIRAERDPSWDNRMAAFQPEPEIVPLSGLFVERGSAGDFPEGPSEPETEVFPVVPDPYATQVIPAQKPERSDGNG